MVVKLWRRWRAYREIVRSAPHHLTEMHLFNVANEMRAIRVALENIEIHLREGKQ